MDEFQPSSLEDEAADAVERLLADCLTRPEDERTGALHAARRDHPELADVLDRRLETLRSLGIDVSSEGAPEFPERLGDFRLLRRLGGGGMGVVYLAVQTSLKRDVALKMIRPERLFFAGARERFEREAEAVAQLQHPGIVPVYTVGEDDGVPWFAMEYVAGRTLAERLESLRGRSPESLTGADVDAPGRSWVDACLGLALQVAEALAHAHARGILHRDVKPSNIMVTPDGRARLLDFGLASAEHDEPVTRSGSQLGTLPYMSPEQVRAAGELDARTDVYSLGATLYELLALQVPYRGEDELDTQRRIVDGAPDSLRARNRDVAEDVETVCLKAMDRDPERRYASADALAEDLTNLLERRPPRARPPGVVLRARRWTQRHPARATALALGLALLAGVPTALWVQEQMYAETLRKANARQRSDLEKVRSAGRQNQATLEFLTDLFREASSTLASGEVLTAIGVIDYGVESVERAFDDPLSRGRALLALGRVHVDLREYARAVPVLERAARELRSLPDERADGPISERRALEGGACLSLAEALRGVGRTDDAVAQAERALELWGDTQHAVTPFVEHAEIVLAGLWGDQGRHEEAEALRRDVLARIRGRGDQPDEEVARAMAHLGATILKQRRYEEADELIAPALEVLRRTLPPDHPDLVAMLSNAGFAAKGLGRLDEAQGYYDEALRLARELWPNENVSLAVLLLNRASLQGERGELAAAVDGHREALELFERLLPEGHPTLELARRRMAEAQGRIDAAEGVPEKP